MTEAFQGSRAEWSGHFLDELRATFANRANRVALLYKDHTLIYGDLGAKARCCAGRLRELEVEPEDRVAIATPEKRPADLLFVLNLPRNAMGKVLRRELRDQLSSS